MPKRRLRASARRGGHGGGQNKKKKKRDMHRKQGQKPHRIALRSAPVVLALSPLSLFSPCVSATAAAPVPYRRYKQTAAGHTGEVTNAGHLHLAARVLPPCAHHPLPLPPIPSPAARFVRPHRNPRAFRRCLFSPSVLQPFLPRSRSRSRIAHNEGARVCNFIMYDGFPPHGPQLAPRRASWHLQIFRF